MATELTDTADATLATAGRKVAIITGASSGIGRATAQEFARQGYHVVLTARRDKELQKAAEECVQHGVQAIGVVADTTDEQALQRVADAAVVAFGGFDIWVNDAAVAAYGTFLETPVADFRRVLDTNVMGYVHGARIALAHFRVQGHGTLINISSINAVAPIPNSAAYVTSKYAVRGLSESLRMELETEGLARSIHVCNVMPASVDTNLYQNAANYTGREVQALEPVYDPSYVAKHIVKLAEEPKREIIIGPAGKAMAAEHAVMPNLYERFVGAFVQRNTTGDRPVEPSAGSLYSPVGTNGGTTGGWRDTRVRADTLNLAVGTAAAVLVGLASAGYVMTRRLRSSA